MSVNLGVQSRQKRKWSRRCDTFSFVLNVIDNEAIDRQRPKARQLLGHDWFQLFRWGRLLGRSEPIETDPTPPGGQFLCKGTIHYVSHSWYGVKSQNKS